jgi:hypothetical protein
MPSINKLLENDSIVMIIPTIFILLIVIIEKLSVESQNPKRNEKQRTSSIRDFLKT